MSACVASSAWERRGLDKGSLCNSKLTVLRVHGEVHLRSTLMLKGRLNTSFRQSCQFLKKTKTAPAHFPHHPHLKVLHCLQLNWSITQFTMIRVKTAGLKETNVSAKDALTNRIKIKAMRGTWQDSLGCSQNLFSFFFRKAFLTISLASTSPDSDADAKKDANCSADTTAQGREQREHLPSTTSWLIYHSKAAT